jgi:Low-density lipoprotein receptor repeat class B
MKYSFEGACVRLAVLVVIVGGLGQWEALGNGKMYWTDLGIHKVQRVNLNGTSLEDLVTTGLIAPRGIALDVVGVKMYWTDAGSSKIQRANLDGYRRGRPHHYLFEWSHGGRRAALRYGTRDTDVSFANYLTCQRNPIILNPQACPAKDA